MTDVIFNNQAILEITPATIDELKRMALCSPRKRARLCMHHSTDHQTQEMLIVFHRDSFMPPHRHPQTKSESYHIVEGSMDVLIFDDAGVITRKVEMSEAGSDKTFLYRLSGSIWHMPLPTSEWLVYHETYTGPFDKVCDVEYAPWSPSEEDSAAAVQYMRNLLGLHHEEK